MPKFKREVKQLRKLQTKLNGLNRKLDRKPIFLKTVAELNSNEMNFMDNMEK